MNLEVNSMRFPPDLLISQETVAELSPQEVIKLFAKAQDYGVLDEFSDYFWSMMSIVNPKPVNLLHQRALVYLEDYKRHLGRAYNNYKSEQLKLKYNSLELFIQEYANEYDLKRVNHNYLLVK